LKGGKLIWIQNEKSRLIFMVNEPNVLISTSTNDDDDVPTNLENINTRSKNSSGSNSSSSSSNAKNNNSNSNSFYYTVPLQDPGMIVIKIPTITSSSLPSSSLPSSSQSQSILRLRWIVEDIDTFHTNGKYKESYFSSVMVDEFFHPIIAVEKNSEETRHLK
jgi:hypothetical protein